MATVPAKNEKAPSGLAHAGMRPWVWIFKPLGRSCPQTRLVRPATLNET